MRITPWVAGCCGPKLTSRSVVWTSRKNSRSPVGSTRPSFSSVMLPCGSPAMVLPFPRALLARDPVVLLGEHVVLAQRETFPVVGEQDVARIGVPDERDAEHLRALALVPLRGAVDRRGRGHPQIRLREQRLDRQALPALDRE